jgi:hypothetical protein
MIFLESTVKMLEPVFLLFYLFNSPCKITIKHITDSESPYRPGSSATVQELTTILICFQE